MNGIVSVVIALAGIGFGVWAALTFWKAGNFKLKGTKEAFAAAGFGWAEKTPLGAIRTIGFLEVLGAIGVVLAPAVALIPGLEFAQYLAVAAGLGLVLTMVGAMITHQSRGESKYTFKMNFKLLAISLVAAVLDALVVLPLTF
jgi:hypothetical protein